MDKINAEKLNYIVYRYLYESGFQHSAYNFACESSINNSSIDGNRVPAGALVGLVQKGLQYIEMEANLGNNDTDVDGDFLSKQPFELHNLNMLGVRRVIEERKRQKAAEEHEKLSKEKESATKKGMVIEDNKKERKRKDRDPQHNVNFNLEENVIHGEEHEKLSKEKESEKKKKGIVIEDNKKERKRKDRDPQDNVNFNLEENVIHGGPEPMAISTSSRPRPFVGHSSNVLMLQGHSNEVCACAWSPVELLLASGSGDSTARIWGIADWTNSISLENRIASVRVLKHAEGTTAPNEKRISVATLDWNSDGTLLATGSYDGRARIWTKKGELTGTLNKHEGAIISVKWNKNSDFLLTGSFDRTATVWDVKANVMMQQFKFHSGPILDVDWRSNHSFASCSADAMVYLCKIGEDQPIKMFLGMSMGRGEVNCVKWDPSGLLLASCSDDCTAKIWSLKQDKHIYDLKDHAKRIYTIKWSPTGPATKNPNKQLILASASYDSTVKMWDVEHGRLISSLIGHSDAVFALSFSPNGEYLASGSADKKMHIWSLKDGKIIKKLY